MFDFGPMKEALECGRAALVKEQTEKALAEGVEPRQILSEGLIAAMAVVGVKFRNNEVFIPEVLVAARAMYAGLDLIRPLLARTGAKGAGRLVIGTVKGDLHDIGKNLVKMMFEGAGFDVVDLGIDVSPQRFVEAVRGEQPDFLGMSALLTTTMPAMKETVEALTRAGLRDRVKVLVGGAPLTDNYAREIGADGYAADASTAVEIARKLLE